MTLHTNYFLDNEIANDAAECEIRNHASMKLNSAQVQLMEDLSQIVEEYVEFIKLKVWKLISARISTECIVSGLISPFLNTFMHL